MPPEIRESRDDDADDVAQLLDAAMLEFDREQVHRQASDGDVLVAVDDGTVVGACVLGRVDRGESVDPDPTEIESIAVHRSRRGRGIGRALVETAASRAAGPLVARFHQQVRPFYEALDFEIRAPGADRVPDDGSHSDADHGSDAEPESDADRERDGDAADTDDRFHGVLR